MIIDDYVIKQEKYVEFYGMSSDTAMIKHTGKVNEYRTSEGKTSLVPYKGPVDNVLRDILGGLRSTCTYVGYHVDDLNAASFDVNAD